MQHTVQNNGLEMDPIAAVRNGIGQSGTRGQNAVTLVGSNCFRDPHKPTVLALIPSPPFLVKVSTFR